MSLLGHRNVCIFSSLSVFVCDFITLPSYRCAPFVSVVCPYNQKMHRLFSGLGSTLKPSLQTLSIKLAVMTAPLEALHADEMTGNREMKLRDVFKKACAFTSLNAPVGRQLCLARYPLARVDGGGNDYDSDDPFVGETALYHDPPPRIPISSLCLFSPSSS